MYLPLRDATRFFSLAFLLLISRQSSMLRRVRRLMASHPESVEFLLVPAQIHRIIPLSNNNSLLIKLIGGKRPRIAALSGSSPYPPPIVVFHAIGWDWLILIYPPYYFPIIILDLRVDESFCFSNDPTASIRVLLPFLLSGFPNLEFTLFIKINFGHDLSPPFGFVISGFLTHQNLAQAKNGVKKEARF
jgi:hypothetical protein